MLPEPWVTSWYRRTAGIEEIQPGYRRFRVQPLPGGDLTWAESHTETPYGKIALRWERNGFGFYPGPDGAHGYGM